MLVVRVAGANTDERDALIVQREVEVHGCRIASEIDRDCAGLIQRKSEVIELVERKVDGTSHGIWYADNHRAAGVIVGLCLSRYTWVVVGPARRIARAAATGASAATGHQESGEDDETEHSNRHNEPAR